MGDMGSSGPEALPEAGICTTGLETATSFLRVLCCPGTGLILSGGHLQETPVEKG